MKEQNRYKNSTHFTPSLLATMAYTNIAPGIHENLVTVMTTGCRKRNIRDEMLLSALAFLAGTCLLLLSPRDTGPGLAGSTCRRHSCPCSGFVGCATPRGWCLAIAGPAGRRVICSTQHCPSTCKGGTFRFRGLSSRFPTCEAGGGKVSTLRSPAIGLRRVGSHSDYRPG